MTNEEAIAILKREFSECKDTISVYAKKRKQAFDMAIKALEQQPILDKIRAEIEALKNAPPCFDDMFEYKCAVNDVLAIIDEYKGESEETE